MLQKVWDFTKSPDGMLWRHISTETKLKTILHLLSWGLFLGLSIGLFIGWITDLLEIDLGTHATEKYLKNYSILWFIFLAVILAPVLEELVFRGPLSWFRNKSYFKYIFYASIILFAGVHLSNFRLPKETYALAPILVAPQMVLGAFLGYARIRLGLFWAIILHASYNAVLILPIAMINLFNFSPT
ncbi:hypothetical protein KCTC52924_03119 [Arenibacter antarcticus]|uniref:CPBP family intramembrane glutamic endopeptidase n=1 Tax=Arenibacter antarcticus TaxID=2040469 RepID=A0ABW5VJI7_9FLAO|nr:CPBP family intramembrane glutamic endopeptidase [Arenibacter sp. H213]MCM4166196.1 CPBP family intramembrane metalloprotease [Arenibacter sp. H213]